MAQNEINKSEAKTLLRMQNIHKRFGATIALEDISLELVPGKVHALVGENGAGKSTLMKILSGVLQPDNGGMSLNGQTFRPAGPQQAKNEGVVMVYQELALAPHLSVEENLLLGAEPCCGPFVRKKKMRNAAMQVIDFFGHPEITPAIRVDKLSIAAQQLVEIGRALVLGCRVLVLDEPTSSLATHDIERLFSLIDSLKKKGIAIVYISHFLEEVKQIADEVTILRDGKNVAHESMKNLTIDRMASLMVGRDIQQFYPKTKREPKETILEINNLTSAVKPKNASLKLKRGEVLGIAGLVGSGRTELLRTIFGLQQIKSGDIKIGTYRGAASVQQRWSQGMGMLTEDRKIEGLALSMSIADNVTLSKLDGLGPWRWILPLRQNKAASKWIDKLAIRCAGAKQTVENLSGGNQQKVALARLLHHDVDVLLLDEPTRGIDVAAKALFYQVIDDLAAGKNGRPRAILMVSSYLPELLGVCDRIAVMNRGKLGKAKPVNEVDENSIILEATQ